MQHVVIIGNGIAGITAAIELRKISSCEITILSNESDFFFARTALMYVYLGQLKWSHLEPYEANFWESQRLHLVKGLATNIDFSSQTIHLQDGQSLLYTQLIIACGSRYKVPDIPGVNALGVRGLYSKQDFDFIWEHTKGRHYQQPKIKNAVIMGGGLIGVELAEMLINEGIEVNFVVRDSSFWRSNLPLKESQIITDHIQSHGIRLHLSAEVSQILDKNGKVSHVELKDGTILKSDFVGLTIGVEPNVDWLRNTQLKINRGILVNDKLETNIPGVFAIGDCAEIQDPQKGRKAIEPVWYVGRNMGESVAKIIASKEDHQYLPGLWFNSAKFFDLDYHVYGDIQDAIDGKGISLIFQNDKLMIRFVFAEDKLTGLIVVGGRAKQEIAEFWIDKKMSLKDVEEQYHKVMFEEEFSKLPTKKIIHE